MFISSLALPTSRLVIFLTVITGNFSFAAAESLPVPLHVAVGGTKQQIAANVLAARRYAAFWNTGDVKYAAAALAPGFIDRTLPAGRPQGAAGPLQASQVFRRAVPDLTAEIQDMVVAGIASACTSGSKAISLAVLGILLVRDKPSIFWHLITTA